MNWTCRPAQFVQALFPLAVGKLAYMALLVPGGVFVDAAGPQAGVLGGMAGLAAVTAVYTVAVRASWAVGAAHVALAASSSVSGMPVYSVIYLWVIWQWGGDGARHGPHPVGVQPGVHGGDSANRARGGAVEVCCGGGGRDY